MKRPFRAIVEAVESRLMLSADLATSFRGAVPETLSPLAKQKLTVRVSNVGDARATGAAAVTLFASADGSLGSDDARLGEAVRSLRLKPGKSANVKLNIPASTLPAGSYTLLASVNTSSSPIADANPANDVTAAPKPVTVPEPTIDLTGRFTHLPPEALEAFPGGRSARTTVRVFNAGNSIAQGPLEVGVYLSQDRTFDAATDILLGTSPAKSITLKPNGKKDVAVPLAAPPAGTPAGRYSLIAFIDRPNAIAETDEANNTFASATPIWVVTSRRRDPDDDDDDDHHHHHPHDPYPGVYIDDPYPYDEAPPIVVIDDDDFPPPDEPYAWSDPAPQPEPYVPPPTDDVMPDPWNDYAGNDDVTSDPWDDYAGGDDVWLGDDW
jgi:hypothetical protein